MLLSDEFIKVITKKRRGRPKIAYSEKLKEERQSEQLQRSQGVGHGP